MVTLSTNSKTLVPLVAISLLGRGVDTAAARAFKLLICGDGLMPAAFDPAATIEALGEAMQVPPTIWRDRMRRADQIAHAALAMGDRAGLGVLTIDAADYPPILRHIVDPPVALWVKGDLSAFAQRAIAVVGSRQGSPIGLMAARRLGNDLAAAGITVVSGLARGVDGAAHRGALDGAGATIAVLGCGADVIYPREHRDLAAALLERGAIVSEFPPGSSPLPPHFPLRNRIISGLSRAVVVVEAHDQSGSLITARTALEQGRDVLAVPGNFGSVCYRGSHRLIKDGARLVETVEDILEEVGWQSPARPPAVNPDNINEISELEDFIRRGETIGLDDLIERTGRSATGLLAELAELELAGKVAKIAGGDFVRLD